MKRKIAFVVHRFGDNFSGGAEFECMVLASKLNSCYDIEIVTTCAKSNTPWDNYYTSGVSKINGLTVRRFPVDELTETSKDILDSCDEISFADKKWIRSIGPFTPKLMEYFETNGDAYEAVIFFTYSVYTTFAGMALKLKKKIMVPTAHAEPYIYKDIYKHSFKNTDGFIYNTLEEKELVDTIFKNETANKKYCTTCFGLDLANIKNKVGLFKRDEDYAVYVGRVSGGKNYRQLNEYFIEYKKRNPSTLKLLVLGTVDDGMEIKWNKDIEYFGYVSEEEKYSVLSKAKLLLMPSKFESLSIVLLESWALGVPVIANAECDVLRGQCIRSNAGLYYENYEEFEKAINYMMNNSEDYKTMSNNGIKFIEEKYNWEFVTQNVANCIEGIINE